MNVNIDEDLLPRLRANLLASSIAVDTSWITKISEEMARYQKELVASIALPDFSGVDLQESIKQGIRTLALRGWTIQMSLTARDLEELASQTPEEADEFFVAFYTDEQFTELRKVREEMSRRPRLAQWHALLEECFDSFENGRHLITIPALLSIIDGVIASAGAVVTARRTHLIEACVKEAEKVGGNSIRAEMWNSMKLFVERLFEPVPFDGARPTLINRHWILHGRDGASWTVADALRLFNALQTVDSLLV